MSSVNVTVNDPLWNRRQRKRSCVV